MQLNDGRVVTNLIVQALNNEDITPMGMDPKQSFSYVMIQLWDSSFNGPDQYDVFNIGNPKEMTINELSETILKLTNSKSKIVYKASTTTLKESRHYVKKI